MNKIVNLMVDKYKLRDYGLDFMGYVISDSKEVTYHHLVISRRNGGRQTVKNGAILIRNSHRYLHMIEKDDYDKYLIIRNLLIEENRKGIIDLTILRDINILLNEFEENNVVDDIFKKRFLKKVDIDILNNIEKYKLV